MAEPTELDLAKLRRQLARLDDSMGSGVLRVEQADGGGSTVYRSYDEMQKARAKLVRDIDALAAKLSGTPRRRRTSRISLIGTSGF